MSLYEILNDTPNLNITINAGQLKECIDYLVDKKMTKQKYEAEERMLTTEEACKIAKVSRPTLHRWKKAGLVPYVKIGKNVRYKHSDLIETLNKSCVNGRQVTGKDI